MSLSAEDQLAIMDLSARYTHASDAHQAEAFADLFTDDGVIEGGPGGPAAGRDAIVAFAQGVNTNMPTVTHYVSNLSINGEGAAAKMTSYLNLMDKGDEGAKTVFMARYEDELVKTDGSWKFAKRNIVF